MTQKRPLLDAHTNSPCCGHWVISCFYEDEGAAADITNNSTGIITKLLNRQAPPKSHKDDAKANDNPVCDPLPSSEP